MSSFVLTRKFLFFACLRDLRDKVLKRIKKALKSNQKQLDLRAMRHLDIILAKKLVSSICPRDDFGEAKNPYISRLFRIPWVIPTRLRVLSHSYFSPYFGLIPMRFLSFCFVFLCILCVLSPFGTVLVSKFGINFLKNWRRKNPLFFLSN